jgi:hypothetical protein
MLTVGAFWGPTCDRDNEARAYPVYVKYAIYRKCV